MEAYRSNQPRISRYHSILPPRLIGKIILVIFIWSSFSCSLHIEKRKYRPGYHVDVVQNHHRIKTNKINNESVKIDNYVQKSVLIPTSPTIVESGPLKKVNVTTERNFVKDNNKPLNIKRDPLRSNKIINVHSPSKKLNKVLDGEKSNSIPKRKKVAGILGSISIGLFALALIFLIIFGTSGFIVPYWGIIELILAVAALILAIIALAKGIKKTTELERKMAEAEKLDKARMYKPVSAGFINTSFIFSIIIMGLALVGFIFSFFLNPFELIGFILNTIVFLGSIVSFSLGFRALKDDKSIKTKLILIFGFIALILTIVGMILFFISV